MKRSILPAVAFAVLFCGPARAQSAGSSNNSSPGEQGSPTGLPGFAAPSADGFGSQPGSSLGGASAEDQGGFAAPGDEAPGFASPQNPLSTTAPSQPGSATGPAGSTSGPGAPSNPGLTPGRPAPLPGVPSPSDPTGVGPR